MQNIRLAIKLTAIKGARVVRMNDANNQPQVYVAIPVSECFVPRDKPEPRLMLTAIHTPNAQYGNFMLKPYVSADDYATLSKEERENLPIVGKGSFIQPQANQELTRSASNVEAADVTLEPTADPTADNGSAAPLFNAPSPSEARPATTSAVPQTATAPQAPSTPYFAIRYFVVDGNHAALGEFDTLEDAAAFHRTTFAAVAIEAWNEHTRLGIWHINAVTSDVEEVKQ